MFAATYSHIKRNASSNGGTTPPTRWIVDHILKDVQRRYFLLQALSNARHYLHSDPIYSTYFIKHTCLPPPRTSSVNAYTMVKYMLLSLPIVPLSEASPKCYQMSSLAYLRKNKRSCWTIRCCHARRRLSRKHRWHLRARYPETRNIGFSERACSLLRSYIERGGSEASVTVVAAWKTPLKNFGQEAFPPDVTLVDGQKLLTNNN